MKLARAIHFDESDMRVFASPARTGEWCIPGGFEFSNWAEADLVGKARQAFANGWFGLETGVRATFVAVTPIEPGEVEELTALLAARLLLRLALGDQFLLARITRKSATELGFAVGDEVFAQVKSAALLMEAE